MKKTVQAKADSNGSVRRQKEQRPPQMADDGACTLPQIKRDQISFANKDVMKNANFERSQAPLYRSQDIKEARTSNQMKRPTEISSKPERVISSKQNKKGLNSSSNSSALVRQKFQTSSSKDPTKDSQAMSK